MLAGGVWGQDCAVSTVPVQFGQYISIDPLPVDAVGNVKVTCGAGTPFMIKLDPGESPAKSFHPREMRSATGGAALGYNLFRNVSRTEVWGDGTNSTFAQPGVGRGVEELFPVYGRIPGRQNVGVGFFRDSITVTVEW
jgi:spore coat protein U-like protein